MQLLRKYHTDMYTVQVGIIISMSNSRFQISDSVSLNLKFEI